MAPRLAEMKAMPVTQAGSDRPDSRKSSEVAMARRARTPMVTTSPK